MAASTRDGWSPGQKENCALRGNICSPTLYLHLAHRHCGSHWPDVLQAAGRGMCACANSGTNKAQRGTAEDKKTKKSLLRGANGVQWDRLENLERGKLPNVAPSIFSARSLFPAIPTVRPSREHKRRADADRRIPNMWELVTKSGTERTHLVCVVGYQRFPGPARHQALD
ncbi:hypothetical protein B0T21DRAFT_347352 [Apiosordaria backusii]|uniref:Uncharacterized protein n=1 Tax=Apiosordaria backusii TaxID=314023 RepID=A0AA40EGK1_9PEZI|nr:hypothetical protein B0T21DRAFT_347352 [Apiosordaria backusii]